MNSLTPHDLRIIHHLVLLLQRVLPGLVHHRVLVHRVPLVLGLAARDLGAGRELGVLGGDVGEGILGLFPLEAFSVRNVIDFRITGIKTWFNTHRFSIMIVPLESWEP